MGRDALAAEVAGHGADRHLLVGEGEVHQSSHGPKTHAVIVASPCARSRRRARARVHSIVGIEKAAPSLMPEGQRAVTVLVRV